MCFIVALISTVVIWSYDKKLKGNLNMSPKQRKEYEDARYDRNINNTFWYECVTKDIM